MGVVMVMKDVYVKGERNLVGINIISQMIHRRELAKQHLLHNQRSGVEDGRIVGSLWDVGRGLRSEGILGIRNGSFMHIRG
jgi:hypothetical protein